MKRFFIAAITLVSITLTQAKEANNNLLSETTEQLINTNLPTLAFTVPVRCSTRIKKLILKEIWNGKHETEATLGRSSLYFPIFEHYIRKYDLPEELKYIPYIETRLKAGATSEVGAGGLWQFMPYTARSYQLRTNHLVDDRYDPVRSTEAATRFLQDLYVEFDDWLLVLAAYNCGAGCVQKAIRLSKSRDFWHLERYLPTQTRDYIPKFIAAVYVGKFYEAHELKPKKFIFNFKNVKILKLRQGVRLKDLAKVTDLPVATIRLLNPAYAQGIVPATHRGSYLILPAATIAVAQRYLATVNGRAAEEVKIIPIGSIAEVPIDPLSNYPLLCVPAKRDSQQLWAHWDYGERFLENHTHWLTALIA